VEIDDMYVGQTKQAEQAAVSLNELMMKTSRERQVAKSQRRTDNAMAVIAGMQHKIDQNELTKTAEASWNKLLESIATVGAGGLSMVDFTAVAEGMGAVEKPVPYAKQMDNWGVSHRLAQVSLFLTFQLQVLTMRSKPTAPPSALSTLAAGQTEQPSPRRNGVKTLFNPSTVDARLMVTQKKKKEKKTTNIDRPKVDRKSFLDYAEDFLSQDGMLERIKKGREAFRNSGFAMLRAQLGSNTMDRIRVAMFDALGVTFPGSVCKAELIQRCLVQFEERFTVDKIVAPFVADFGIIIETVEGGVLAGELMLLEHNSVDSLAGPCVEEIGQMSGWVKRDMQMIKVMVDCENIDWAKLYLHKKVILE
jgi:hypothetical protein